MFIRSAVSEDIPAICRVYNQGIEDRIATLETRLRTCDEMTEWFAGHGNRYAVVVADDGEAVQGWASINPFSGRCCYDGVGDLSIYVDRNFRGKGVGHALLDELCREAVRCGFHKLILSTFSFNEQGQRLYRRHGFREVGTYVNQGILDGRFINVTIMEKLLPPVSLSFEAPNCSSARE